jgi:hypothetical protein
MVRKKHPAWLVIEPAIGVGVAVAIGWFWVQGAIGAAKGHAIARLGY